GTVLAGVFASVLGVAAVGATHNVFHVGGDSLACVRVAGAARARGIEASTADVFLHQTVAELAEGIGRRSPETRAASAVPVQVAAEPPARLLREHDLPAMEAYPLTAYQQWALDRHRAASDPATHLVVSSYRTR